MYYFNEGIVLDNNEYKNFSSVNHGLADHQIIFTKNNEVVYSERLPSGVVEGYIKNEIIFNYQDPKSVKEYDVASSSFWFRSF